MTAKHTGRPTNKKVAAGVGDHTAAQKIDKPIIPPTPRHGKPAARAVLRLPDSLEAERACVGAMLLDAASAIPQVKPLLADGEPFLYDDLRKLYQAALELHDRGIAVDLVTVTHLMNAEPPTGPHKSWADVAIEACESVPSWAHAEHYARIVHDCHRRRELAKALRIALRRLADGADDVQQIANSLIHACDAVIGESHGR